MNANSRSVDWVGVTDIVLAAEGEYMRVGIYAQSEEEER